jgi:hypothetical protein
MIHRLDQYVRYKKEFTSENTVINHFEQPSNRSITVESPLMALQSPSNAKANVLKSQNLAFSVKINQFDQCMQYMKAFTVERIDRSTTLPEVLRYASYCNAGFSFQKMGDLKFNT